MLKPQWFDDVCEIRLSATFLGRRTYEVSAYFFAGTLIDSGMPKTASELAHWGAEHEINQIILTHHHEDHVGGARALRRVPHIYAPATAVPWLQTPRPLPLYRRLTFGRPQPITTEPYPTDMRLKAGPHELSLIHTPGHALDHHVVYVPERGILFGADLFVEERARYVRRRDVVAEWLASLRKIAALDFEHLFCAHAGYVPDGQAAVKRKIAYWESLGAEAHHLHQRGLDPVAIRDRLLGPERSITRFSCGRYSKLNLINGLLGTAALAAPQPVGHGASDDVE